MNRKLKTFFSIFFSVTLISALITSCANAGGSGGYTDPYAGLPFNKEKLYDQTKVITDNGNKTFNDVTAATVVNNMKFGWNLGNTLDAINGDEKTGRTSTPHNAGLSSETCWSMPKTTEAIFDAIKAKGFSSVRIPVSWSNHIIDDCYTIDPQWMTRVKTIVDWAISKNLYVILNIHHDNVAPGTLAYARGYCPNEADLEESQRFLYNIWCQIATAFNTGYDEHLIFETINEPRLPGDTHEWNWNSTCETCRKSMSLINRYNKLCLDAIRDSGGNNTNRIVMFPAYVAAPYAAIDGKNAGIFTIPTDSAQNKLALSVHMYTPYNFAMNTDTNNNATSECTDDIKAELRQHFVDLNSNFISQGIPVVIGEMGATNKDNDSARTEWFTYYLGLCKQYKVAAVLWDNGSTDNENASERFGFFNRSNCSWYFPDMITAAVNARN
ncbi:MAG: glycoside hydrolase family 5 protein [Treponema sp.]|uniref:glycoside hydrolase family 5 protein n=1 Tax=Treponema sp. TaxID=166 RepID=UPI00298E3386|nr:glycoside hydrolase family 5 protein [Treponema sp.]MBR5933366.1 glycoside hydrolase family 5 protein [Treponema sp.]